MRLRWIPLYAAILVGVAAGAGSARAQDKPDYEKAKQHYTTATQAMAQGDYRIAAREFGVAYEITKDPILFFKIAWAFEQAGDCESALIYYGRYLREANPSDKDRSDAEGRVASCQEALGKKPGGGDGGGGPADGPPSDEGDEGGPPADIVTDPTGGDEVGGDDAAAPTFLDSGTSWQRTAAWVSVGLAVAAGTTASVLGLSASSREEDVDTLVNFRAADGLPRAYEGEIKRQYEEFVQEGKDLQTYSRIAWGVAGGAAAAAVVFFILAPEGGEGRASAAAPRSIVPVVAEGSLGLSAGWEF
jgi:hypothetical protein